MPDFPIPAAPAYDWFHIVYLKTGPGDDVPPEGLMTWTMEKSAHVRWQTLKAEDVVAQAGQLAQAGAPACHLVVLEWNENKPALVEDVFTALRRNQPNIPILAVTSHIGSKGYLSKQLQSDRQARPAQRTLEAIKENDLNLNAPIHMAAAFALLQAELPAPKLRLSFEQNDLSCRELVAWVNGRFGFTPQASGRGTATERPNFSFELLLQKYFPLAREAHVRPLPGARGDVRLCLLRVEQQTYLLNFTNELAGDDAHQQVEMLARECQWLGELALSVCEVPDLPRRREGFPRAPWQYPFPQCFATQLSRAVKLASLSQYYRRGHDAEVTQAVARLLNQWATFASAPPPPDESPWGFQPADPFYWSREDGLALQFMLEDLTPYAEHLYRQPDVAAQSWSAARTSLEQLTSQKLPEWLAHPRPVRRGPTYNHSLLPNCLIFEDGGHRHVRLLPCGRHTGTERLVSDLARMERDTKLTLLATDGTSPDYRDLAIDQLASWCQMETESLRQGLSYEASATPPVAARVLRAYRLIQQIRQTAARVCANIDPDGVHYFAALLYWTLEGLQSLPLRSTKQLLALHSAAELLRFMSPPDKSPAAPEPVASVTSPSDKLSVVPAQTKPWLWLLLLAAVVGLAVVSASGWLRFGLAPPLTYVIYVLSALVAAGVCFGVLKSTGEAKGEKYGVALKLGGPAALFAAVLGGGIWSEMQPRRTLVFSQRVNFYREQTTQLEKLNGSVGLSFGTDHREVILHDGGTALFQNIPGEWLGQSVRLDLNCPDYELQPTTDEPVFNEQQPLVFQVVRKRRHVAPNEAKLDLGFEEGRAVRIATRPTEKNLMLSVRADSPSVLPLPLAAEAELEVFDRSGGRLFSVALKLIGARLVEPHQRVKLELDGWLTQEQYNLARTGKRAVVKLHYDPQVEESERKFQTEFIFSQRTVPTLR